MDSPPPILFASITAFSMTLAICLYLGLCILGYFLRKYRLKHGHASWGWLRYLHYGLGITFVLNILELMTFGIIGANIYDGTEGHSPHLPAGPIYSWISAYFCLVSQSCTSETALGSALARESQWFGFRGLNPCVMDGMVSITRKLHSLI